MGPLIAFLMSNPALLAGLGGVAGAGGVALGGKLNEMNVQGGYGGLGKGGLGNVLKDLFGLDGTGLGLQGGKKLASKVASAAKSAAQQKHIPFSAKHARDQILLELIKSGVVRDMDGDGDVDVDDARIMFSAMAEKAASGRGSMPVGANGGTDKVVRGTIVVEVKPRESAGSATTLTKLSSATQHELAKYKLEILIGDGSGQPDGEMHVDAIAAVPGTGKVEGISVPYDCRIKSVQVRPIQANTLMDAAGFALDVAFFDSCQGSSYVGPVLLSAESDRNVDSVKGEIGGLILRNGIVGPQLILGHSSFDIKFDGERYGRASYEYSLYLSNKL